jgi:hypothetical protein
MVGMHGRNVGIGRVKFIEGSAPGRLRLGNVFLSSASAVSNYYTEKSANLSRLFFHSPAESPMDLISGVLWGIGSVPG